MRADEVASSVTMAARKDVSFSAAMPRDGNDTGDEEEGGFGFGDENDEK